MYIQNSLVEWSLWNGHCGMGIVEWASLPVPYPGRARMPTPQDS